MVKIVRYLGRKCVTVTIDEDGNVTVTVEPPRKKMANNVLQFKKRNPKG